MSKVKVNGKTFDSGDVKVAAFGSINYEITEITYASEQEHQANHALGDNEMSSYSVGKETHSCTITFRLASINAIEKAAGKKLTKIKPFDVNVTYVNEDNDIINDTVTCKFMDQGREVDGEMDLKRQYNMFVLDIDYNNF